MDSAVKTNNDLDQAVLGYLKDRGLMEPDKYMIHSTSWRYEKPAKILLTYLVIVPTNSPYQLRRSLDIRDSEIASNSKAFKPRPEFIKESNVIRHAFRHVAYLLKHDYQHIYDTMLSKAQKDYISGVYDEVAEEIYTA